MRDDARFICAEEPETNLHPSSIRRLAKSISKIAKEEDKQFLITTHSEALVVSFLTQIVKKELSADDVACYLVTKKGKVSHFERQKINEKGQIEGGLQTFMEAELEDVKAFLGA